MTISNVWVRQTLPETLSALRDVGGQPLLDAVRQSSLGENECSKLMIYDFIAYMTRDKVPQFAICGDERTGHCELVLFRNRYDEFIGDVTAVVGTLKASNVFNRLLLTEERLLAGYDTLLEETGAL